MAARRPYLNLKQSITDMFKGHSVLMAEHVGQESLFEKPYLAPDYRTMHLDIPTPDWTVPTRKHDWERKKWTPPTIEEPEIGGDSTCSRCVITCYQPGASCGDCVECIANVFCTHDPSGAGMDTKWDVNVNKGEVEKITSGSMPFPMLLVCPNVDIHEHLYLITFTDGLGHKCREQVEFACECDCGGAATFTWSAVNVETIARNTSQIILVEGGCRPFTWSVSGTGFTLDESLTDAGYNQLRAGATACGTAVITITDDCGTVITGTIRCTTGTWHAEGSASGGWLSGGPNFCDLYPACADPRGGDPLISGVRKWEFSAAPYYRCVDDPSKVSWVLPSGNWSAPPCGSPVECHTGTSSCPTFNCSCYYVASSCSDWECAA